jgi:hypothetical protein
MYEICKSCPGKGIENCYLGGKIIDLSDVVMKRSILSCRASQNDIGAVLAGVMLGSIKVRETSLTEGPDGSGGYKGGQ